MLGVVTFACAALSGQFPAEPIKVEFERGFALARREKKIALGDLFKTRNPRTPLSRVLQSDRQNIGWWSNGYEQKPTEHVVWLSPPLLSRWLGFLAAQEYWHQEETQERWSNIVGALGHRRAFVVQLSSFPKKPTYGIGDEVRSDQSEIDDVRFVYTTGGTTVEMNAIQLAHWQSRDRIDLDGFLWWHLLPLSGALIGEFDPPLSDTPLPLGDYHRSWTLVWVEFADDPRFEVRVLSRRKERVARFSVKG